MTLYSCFSEQEGELVTNRFGELEVTSLTKLQDIERVSLCDEQDLLVYVCSEMVDVDLQLLLRIMKFAPIPLIVNAKSWQQVELSRLLGCGRVTFVTSDFNIDRLDQEIELAKLRYKLAKEQLQKIKQLESAFESQKLIAKVKAKLQSNGLSESQAHKLLQKQAMETGLSIEQLVLQLPINSSSLR